MLLSHPAKHTPSSRATLPNTHTHVYTYHSRRQMFRFGLLLYHSQRGGHDALHLRVNNVRSTSRSSIITHQPLPSPWQQRSQDHRVNQEDETNSDDPAILKRPPEKKFSRIGNDNRSNRRPRKTAVSVVDEGKRGSQRTEFKGTVQPRMKNQSSSPPSMMI